MGGSAGSAAVGAGLGNDDVDAVGRRRVREHRCRDRVAGPECCAVDLLVGEQFQRELHREFERELDREFQRQHVVQREQRVDVAQLGEHLGVLEREFGDLVAGVADVQHLVHREPGQPPADAAWHGAEVRRSRDAADRLPRRAGRVQLHRPDRDRGYLGGLGGAGRRPVGRAGRGPVVRQGDHQAGDGRRLPVRLDRLAADRLRRGRRLHQHRLRR